MIVTKVILCFLLVDDASESRSLALLVLFNVPLPVDVEFVILVGYWC